MINTLTEEEIDKVRLRGFRPVVVACIFHAGKLLFVYNREHALWQFPQGGIDAGETLREAFYREVREELGDFADSIDDNLEFISEGEIEFPPESQGTREIITESGKEIYMKGKSYFCIRAEAKTDVITLDEAEFDKYKWLDYDKASKFVKTIYQKGKRRIMEEAVETLHEKFEFN